MWRAPHGEAERQTTPVQQHNNKQHPHPQSAPGSPQPCPLHRASTHALGLFGHASQGSPLLLAPEQDATLEAVPPPAACSPLTEKIQKKKVLPADPARRAWVTDGASSGQRPLSNGMPRRLSTATAVALRVSGIQYLNHLRSTLRHSLPVHTPQFLPA